MTDQPRVALPALGEHQAVHTDEHRVVGHELDAHAIRGGCDPAIGLVDLLAERMTFSLALRSRTWAHVRINWSSGCTTTRRARSSFEPSAAKLAHPALSAP